MVDRIKDTIEVHASAHKCYEQWHRFQQFPAYMNRVKEVTQTGDNQWHWVITTPLGRDVEWDAVISSDERNREVSWHTVDHPEVEARGSIHFDEVAPNRTLISCTLEYNVTGGPIKEALAELLVHPQAMLKEEMTNFMHLVEGTNVPAAKVTTGKTLMGTQDKTEKGYDGPFDLEQAFEVEGVEVAEIEDPAIRDMIYEENPYLGVEGAWEEEDAWPETAEETKRAMESDVFTESMDVFDEDLENFTQDLDDNIDSAFVTGESVEEFEMLQEAEQLKSGRATPVESEL